MDRKFMKGIMAGLMALFVALAFAIPAMALDPIFTKNKTGTIELRAAATHDYGAWVVVAGDNNKQPVVSSISATTDSTTTGNVYIYSKENEATVSTTCAAASQLLTVTSGGASFDANDIVVVQSPSGDVCFMESIASGAATLITLNGTLDYAASAGYKVYEMELVGSIPCSNTTITYNGDAIASSAKGSPLLLYIPGKAACSINFASGQYK